MDESEARAQRAGKQLAMKQRTAAFAHNVVVACRSLPRNAEGRLIANQVLRRSTSVAANYRAACQGRSKREFIAKIGLVLEEADESLFWLRFAAGLNHLSVHSTTLITEANELVAIFTATRNTATKRLAISKDNP